MKITVEEQEYKYIYDSCATLSEEEIEEAKMMGSDFLPPMEEAVDAALELLSNIYGKEHIAKYIQGPVPIKGFYKG